MTNWDFDATDSTVFGSFTRWTEKFGLFHYNTTAKNIQAKSYCNLNAGYLGFNYAKDQLIVNGGSRITVYAGSYSGNKAIMTNTTGGMMSSRSVTLTPDRKSVV